MKNWCLAVVTLMGFHLGQAWFDAVVQRKPLLLLLPVPVLAGFICWAVIVRNCFPVRLAALEVTRTRFLRDVAVTCGLAGTLQLLTQPLLRTSISRLVFLGCWAVCFIPVAELTAIGSEIIFPQALPRKWKLRLLASGFGFVVCLFGIGCSEFICGLILAQRPQTGAVKLYQGDYLTSGKFFRTDDVTGSGLLLGRQVNCRLSVAGRLLWDVHYSTDSFGRRTTVVPQSTIPQSRIVLFGCSFLFGEGSEDGQTIASQLCTEIPESQGFNYGVPGWGTQQMLALLESGRISREVPQGVQLGIYLYLPEIHEARVVGDMDFMNSSNIDFPFYSLDSLGKLRRHGSFRTGRPLTNLFYDIAQASRTRALLGLNFPKRSSHHYLLTASIIDQSRQLFVQQFPDARFLMVCYPGPADETLTILECRNRGVEVLNLAGLFDPADAVMSFQGDGHPTPAANQRVAAAIAEYVLPHD